MKKHWAVVVPLLVLGCGAEDANGDGIADGVLKPDSVSVVAPATPKGTVSGQVLDTRMAPLAGATVTLLIGSDASGTQFSAQTDGAGNFMFSGVPAGSTVLLTASKEGYTTLRASADVPSNAGNIPINNGNASVGALMLAETNGTLRFTLYTDSGRPAAGAHAYLQALPSGMVAYSGTPITTATPTTPSVVVSAVVADALGVVTFNTQQRNLILDLLEASDDPLIHQKLHQETDALFVKNLENVQGDERDTILFSVTFSAVAPPPTSRKLAGSPPNSLMVSMVDMARPAPLTRQPMLPSSWM